MVTAAHAEELIGVRLSSTPQGLSVTYSAPRPLTNLPLGLARYEQAIGRARVDGAEPKIAGGVLKANNTFRQATVLVEPDTEVADSTYPLLHRFTDGTLLVYTPYLMPQGYKTRVEIAEHTRVRTLSAAQVDGYLLLGGRQEKHDRFEVFFAPEISVDTRALVVERASQILGFYQAKMRSAPDRRPTLVVAASDQGFRGDVAANGVAVLRVPAKVDATQTAFLSNFLAHELFHLWNRSGDVASANWWLMEGGAEYAGWIASAQLWPTEAPLQPQLDTALKTCALYLGDRAMEALAEPQRRSTRYPCGAVIMWMADLSARKQGARHDLFTIWRGLVSERRSKGAYTPASLHRTLMALEAGDLGPMLLSETGSARWSRLASLLTALGADVQAAPAAPFLLRMTATRTLVREACGQVYGVGEGGDGLFVQAPETCDGFGGENTVIVSVDDLSPLADPQAYYDAISRLCASGARVRSKIKTAQGERVMETRCAAPVDVPPPALAVVRALPPLVG